MNFKTFLMMCEAVEIRHIDPLLYETMLNEVSWEDFKGHFGRNWAKYVLAGQIAAGGGLAGDVYQKNFSRPTSAASKTVADVEYNPQEILAKVMITPRELIKNSSDDPEKWQRDFDKLQAPEKDIGLSTIKDNFDIPVLMYVVKPEAMQRVLGGTGEGAYAAANHIVMPSDQFEVLPTNNSIGKLTKWGTEALRHELRHKTQTFLRKNYSNLSGSLFDKSSDFYKGYMKHPDEMGVRLAAIKNLLSRDNAIKNSGGTYGVYAQEFFQELPDDEKSLFDIVTNPQAYKKYLSPDSRWLKYADNEEVAETMIQDFVKQIKRQNIDVKSLLDFIESLPDNEKQPFINQLQQNMDTVVKGDEELKDRLQQKFAKIKGASRA